MDRRKYTDFVELKEAKDNLTSYFREHNLNPQISYFNHPVHGPILKKLVNRLNLERSKVLDGYRARDPKRVKKLVLINDIKRKENMAKRVKKADKAEMDLATEENVTVKVEKKKKETKEEKKAKYPISTKYDYPLIDGREMDKKEKRKYREQQRKLAKGKTPKEEKASTKEEGKAKPSKVKEKPIKKVKKAVSKKSKVKDED